MEKKRKMTSLGEIVSDPRVDIKRSTLDYYNQEGLIMEPLQTIGKQYIYWEDELLKRIDLIKRLKERNLTLGEIKIKIDHANNSRTNKNT